MPWTLMNRRAKFDDASFILGGKIRNRKNKQTHEMKNSKQHLAYRHVSIKSTDTLLTFIIC